MGGWGRGAAPVLPQVVSAEPSGAACLDGGVRARVQSSAVLAGPWLCSSTGQCVCGLVRHRPGGGRGDRGPKCGLPALPSGLTGPCWVCPGHGGQGTSGRASGERGLVCLSVLWGGGEGGWGQAWRFSEINRAASLPSSPSASTRSAARLTGHGQGVALERCCAPENGVSDKNNPG